MGYSFVRCRRKAYSFWDKRLRFPVENRDRRRFVGVPPRRFERYCSNSFWANYVGTVIPVMFRERWINLGCGKRRWDHQHNDDPDE